MTNKQFVIQQCPSAHCNWYPDRKDCLISAFPNTLWFGSSTKSKSPREAWKKAANILRTRFLKRFES